MADDYGKLTNDYIPTGQSAIEYPDSELESADSIADPLKIGVWVWAISFFWKKKKEINNNNNLEICVLETLDVMGFSLVHSGYSRGVQLN